MHSADALIQSDLQCIFRLYIFCQYMCSLGIEPTTFALLRNALPLSHRNTGLVDGGLSIQLGILD